MEIESTTFGTVELELFLDQLVDRDRRALAARLERASERLGELAARVSDAGASGDDRWNAKEVLAHVAVLSKLYGVLGYRIGTGALRELDLLGQVHLRRRCDMGNGSSMTAEEIIRLPLTSHLEEHVAQLEAALQ
jgi:hypothetical protein